jgi:hypothetical protein
MGVFVCTVEETVYCLLFIAILSFLNVTLRDHQSTGSMVNKVEVIICYCIYITFVLSL